MIRRLNSYCIRNFVQLYSPRFSWKKSVTFCLLKEGPDGGVSNAPLSVGTWKKAMKGLESKSYDEEMEKHHVTDPEIPTIKISQLSLIGIRVVLFGLAILWMAVGVLAQTAPCGRSFLREGGEKEENRFVAAPVADVKASVIKALPAVYGKLKKDDGAEIEATIDADLEEAQQGFGSKGMKSADPRAHFTSTSRPTPRTGWPAHASRSSFPRESLPAWEAENMPRHWPMRRSAWSDCWPNLIPPSTRAAQRRLRPRQIRIPSTSRPTRP